MRVSGWAAGFCSLTPLLLTTSLVAQSITAGALQGTVRGADGQPLSGAAVTIEDAGGGTVRELTSRDDGGFDLRMMLPGTYQVLVELPGYQPVRVRGVAVTAGSTTTLGVELVERPPPITSVTDLFQAGTSAGPSGRVVLERELRSFGYRPDATDLSRGLSELAAPMDGRAGFAQMAAGLPGRLTRVYADGVPEVLLRHPGVPDEPAVIAAIPRDAVTQALVSGNPRDGEWRGTPGSVLSLITRSGTNRLEVAPWVAASSAKLGGNSPLNPADSSGTSFWVGGSLGGPIKRDTAHFFVAGNYQSLQTPEPYPWAPDDGTFGAAAVSVRETVLTIAQDRYGTGVAASVAPVVRTWKGGGGLGRMDWQVGRNAHLMVRAGAAAFQETSPLLGSDVGRDAGASLKGRDISAAVAFTSTATISNEFRAGLALSRRDWQASPLPATRLVAEGVRFGGNAALPGLFETRLLSFSDAVQYQHGAHALKGGVSVDYLNYQQQYGYAAAGRFLFGDLDHFDSGTGVFLRATGSVPTAKVGAPVIGAFIQDSWRPSPGIELLLALRYDAQILPKNRIARNADWAGWTGVSNDSFPQDFRGIQPRLGFVLDPGNRGNWVIQGGVGLYTTGMELASFAEAVQNSGTNVLVTRIVGDVGSWPTAPLTTSSAETSTRLTMFGGKAQYRAPRAVKGDLSVTGSLRGGVTVRLSGAYRHSDYLLRRSDANLAPFPSGEAQDGRPVWGTLHQQGGLVTVAAGTSRRFQDFELASILAPTGFSDHYEATFSVHRPFGRSLSLSAEYTYSRTRDNLVGLREPDPADQLSPFPEGLDGADWDEARSDLDIPHRTAVNLEFRSGGRRPISLGLRGRWRSGLPFTPGFRSGVDVNGDLGTNNDPAPDDAFANPAGPGVRASCEGASVGGFAVRNSCRESGVGSLDARLGIPLPLGLGGQTVVFSVEAFNLVASTTGVVDRAAVLIDPAGTLTINSATGAVSIPYANNPRFGTLLRRAGEPRVVRLGLRLEY